MTEQNLIINGVDHSIFNLEWAKRGGVVLMKCCDTREAHLAKLIHHFGDWANFGFIHENLIVGSAYTVSDDECPDEYQVVRMATPAECEAAGIEYIEYHGWRDIKYFPKPKYTWICDNEDEPVEPMEDEWEWYEVQNICTEQGFVEWFGKWYFAQNEEGNFCAEDIDPIAYMPMPQPPKDE